MSGLRLHAFLSTLPLIDTDMSLRGPKYQRQRHEAYFTPMKHVSPLLRELPPLRRGSRLWEPAAGAGHVAQVLHRECLGCDVIATDLVKHGCQVFPVTAGLDFLDSSGPSGGGSLSIITNPPYGPRNHLAEKFLAHALRLVEDSAGMVAFLLPFEFDAAQSRISMVSAHPAFAFKLTLTTRIRWLNLRQKKNGPMGNHAWFVWDFNLRRRDEMRSRGMLRAV